MAKGAVQFSNDQDVLLSVGPFLGLDTNTSPYFVAPNNATAQQNVVINKQYGAYTTALGRSANYTGQILPANIIAIGVTSYLYDGTYNYIPGIYILTGGFGSVQAYYAGYNQFPIPVINWTSTAVNTSLAVSLQDSKFVFAGQYVFPDIPINQPQLIQTPGTTGITYGATALNWGIAGPTLSITAASGTGSGPLLGNYSWAVTFINSNSTIPIESSASPFLSTLITITNQNAALTGIPVSTDPQVTGRNIYRIGGTIGGTPLLVGTINDNTTTTYTDNLSDSQVTGQQLILRQDPAPTGGWASICLHKGRMWGFGTMQPTASKSDLWYSNYLLYTSFNSVTQVLDCDSTLDDLPVALASLDSVLVAFKQKSIWLCYGDTQNDFITRRVGGIGCVSKGSVAAGYGRVFWLSVDGVYMFDGANPPVNISDGNIPTGSIRNVIDELLAGRNHNLILNDVGVRGWVVNRTYYLSIYSLLGSFDNTVTYAYDISIGAWTMLPYSTSAVGVCPASFFNPLQSGVSGIVDAPIVLAANTNTEGQIDQWFATENDLGTSVLASWTTQITDSGEFGLTKEYRYIDIVAPSQNTYATVTLTVDPGASNLTFGPFTVFLASGSTRSRISLPNGTRGYTCQLTISTNSNTTVTIYKVLVMGYVVRAMAPPPGNV